MKRKLPENKKDNFFSLTIDTKNVKIFPNVTIFTSTHGCYEWTIKSVIVDRK
jgi:hypothetical protein